MRNHLKSVFCLFVIGIGGLLMAACGGSGHKAREAVSSGISVAFPIGERTKSFDTIQMGRMLEGEVIQGRFDIVNNQDKPLVIIQIVTGCGCATVDFDYEPIPAGDNRTVTYRFDSRGRFGQQFKSIEIISAEREMATIYLSGDIYVEK